MSANSSDPRKASFAPVVAPNTRVMILGSLPGVKSLEAQRYYAHPRNRFWYLLGDVLGRELEPLGYEQRLAGLLDAGIGLWDTVASARRTGSLDSAIRSATHNPLADFVASQPGLRAIAFNGGTATKTGTPLLEGSGLDLIALPSSSPAYAAMPLAEKAARWMVLREFLDSPPCLA